MTDIKRTDLFARLHPAAYQAAEGAAVLCRMRGNPYVELAHWLTELLTAGDGDLRRIIAHFAIDEARLAADLTTALDRLPRGASAVGGISGHIDAAIREGWLYASLLFRAEAVRSGHVLLGCLKSPALAGVLLQASREFAKIPADVLADGYPAICPVPAGAAEPAAPAPLPGQGDALARFATDLTAAAEAGSLDPVVGRDAEIRQLIDILLRRRQNNPLLAGEAGVGKTAVVEGLARRIAAGDVPPALRDVRLLALDLALLQAGAGMKGEFEARLRQVIEAVQGAERPTILFIDEAHTLIGAGGAAGQGDAANLLKPALARGRLRTIAATTWGEYKRHIEKDPALARRFQVVQVHEPDDDTARRMLRGMVQRLEEHHRVDVLEEAVAEAVALSRRYIPARQLPDKAVSLLDTACARVALSQGAEPAALEAQRRIVEALADERAACVREAADGIDHGERLAGLQARHAQAVTDLESTTARWRREQALVAALGERRAALRAAAEADRPAAQAALAEAARALAGVQGEEPLIHPRVDGAAVAAVVAEWTGIPVGRMVTDEVRAVLGLPEALRARVRGQDHAIAAVAARIRTARAGLGDPRRPIAVLLLAGPSGVGKTETALALAEALYGTGQGLITINMSEFQEAHTVSTLKGAPPGYVGYGEGGVLTEAVRRRPYSVVLLDEVEKAHRDVHELFFQVFDQGRMEDGEGRGIDFRNTVILLTTNVGSDELLALAGDPASPPTAAAALAAIRPALRRAFPDALLGRMAVVPFLPLPGTVRDEIIRLKLAQVARRVQERHRAVLEVTPAAVAEIARRADQLESGARMVDAVVAEALLPRLAEEFLAAAGAGRALGRIVVDAAAGGFTVAGG